MWFISLLATVRNNWIYFTLTEFLTLPFLTAVAVLADIFSVSRSCTTQQKLFFFLSTKTKILFLTKWHKFFCHFFPASLKHIFKTLLTNSYFCVTCFLWLNFYCQKIGFLDIFFSKFFMSEYLYDVCRDSKYFCLSFFLFFFLARKSLWLKLLCCCGPTYIFFYWIHWILNFSLWGNNVTSSTDLYWYKIKI